MKIKPIPSNHVTNCSWCKLEGNKVQAVWHLTGANKQSCNAHKHQLEAIRDEEQAGSTDYSEGDYQSWLRL